MTALQIAAVPISTLSAKGQKWEASDYLRTIICLTTDYVLHVVQGYGTDPRVLAYIDELRRAKVKATQNYVTPEALKALYGGVTSNTDAFFQASGNANSTGKGKQEQVVDILRNATQAGASDIHFFASPNGHHMRFRVHGELETAQSFVGKDGERMMSAIYETMSEQIGTNYRPGESQDGRLRSELVTECGLFGARIATRPTLNGPWMAMRLLYDNGKLMTLPSMGYLPEQIDALMRMVHRTDGMVFLTGTTGSGKSRGIQTLLNMLLVAMDFTINLVTIEDPVEYRIEKANQTPKAPGEQWDEAIANVMRLDPDVLLVGEARDRASLLAAFQLALTGHGLWSTLHVNAAIQAFQRIHDLGVEDNLVFDPALMKGIVNQSLTRVLCSNCKVPYLQHRERLSADQRSRIESSCIPEQIYLKGEGCTKCSGRGIVDRTAIAEIMQPDLPFMRMYRDHGKAEAQVFWVREQGGITKNEHLIRRINEGIVDPTHGERDVCPLDEDLITIGARR